MPYAGKQVMARDHAQRARKFWRNYELTKAVATAIGESHLFLGAWHDNVDSTGRVLSRDCGVYQFNIGADEIGTAREDRLRTESKDPAVYEPVWDFSVRSAWSYYNDGWVRDGHNDIRRWQAWAAYTSGWATFPYAWVWHHENGVGVGPWVKTGRYLHQAIAGQMNNLVVNEGEWTPKKALDYARVYAHHFGVVDGSEPYLTKDRLGNEIVGWRYPPMPTDPPADGSGPYPVPNNGV